jgi:hypothetical protein
LRGCRLVRGRFRSVLERLRGELALGVHVRLEHVAATVAAVAGEGHEAVVRVEDLGRHLRVLSPPRQLDERRQVVQRQIGLE